MSMQEPEQWQSFETPERTSQEYGSYTAREQDAQEQKIYPQQTPEARVSLLNVFTIIFSGFGFGPAMVGLAGSILVFNNRGGSQALLTAGILTLIGSIVALLFFVTVFVLHVVSAARRAARYRRLHFR